MKVFVPLALIAATAISCSSANVGKRDASIDGASVRPDGSSDAAGGL